MCGISGAYAKELSVENRILMAKVMQSQFSRGPDHQDHIEINGKHTQIWLGHNRLSIIDLTQVANQPMWDVSHRYCIVYNGEIYNYLELRKILEKNGYRFNTKSDTEVILNAFSHWGHHALDYFRGPFAFALFDSRDEKLWLCRDRFGVRPLYYVMRNHVIYFASSTKCLAQELGLVPDYAYVARGLKYLIYEDNTDISPYQDMFCVPSGCYLYAHFNEQGKLITEIQSYYHLAEKVANLIDTLPTDIPSLLELLSNRFEESVKIRLRTDVPLAISLSGGLDSSTVAASVSEKHGHTMAFSFAHPGHKKSEGPVIKKCVEFLDLDIEYVWPNANEMNAALFQTIDAQDAPFPSLSIVAQFLLYQHVHATGIKVLLGGQGGDEVFMGYRKFLFYRMKALLKSKQYLSCLSFAMQLVPGFLSEVGNLKTYWAHRHRYFKTNQMGSLLNLPEPTSIKLNHDKPWLRQLQDITEISLPSLLRYEDRNAMGNSVESRLPFLDHELVELGLAMPETLKLRGGYGKWIVRQMVKDKIPDSIRLARYKRGFDIPLKTLLKEGLGQSIRSSLKEKKQMTSAFLKQHSDIDTIFSDKEFIQTHARMAEAITLLWLGKRLT